MQEDGYQTLSADQVVHRLLEPTGRAYPLVVAEFSGHDLFATDGQLDRKKLGAIVFSDPEKLRRLEAILHPLVAEQFVLWRNRYAQEALIIYEIPLLFEKGRQGDFDKILCISVPAHIQKRRLRERDALSESEAEQRIAQQWPQVDKERGSDFVFVNDYPDLSSLREAFRRWYPQHLLPPHT